MRGTRQARGRTTWEGGFTLIEILIASALGLIVVGAAMSFVIVALHQQNTSASRTSASRQAEAGMEQLVRDLRQAMSQDSSGDPLNATVSTSASSLTTSVQFYIPTPGNASSQQSVTWTCPSAAEPSTYIGTCYRQLAGGANQSMITGVQAMTFTPIDSGGAAHLLNAASTSSYNNPASITMTLSLQVVSQAPGGSSTVPAGTANPVTMSTSADLRNFS